MGDEGGVVAVSAVSAVSAGHEYMGSGIVSSEVDLLEMSVVRGMRGVGGVLGSGRDGR